MNAAITSKTFSEIIPGLAETFGTVYSELCDEFVLRLPDTIGEGFIRGIDFNHGIGLTQWNCIFREAGGLYFAEGGAPPLEMLFCLEGSLAYTIEGEVDHHLHGLRGILAAGQVGRVRRLSWKAGEPVRFTMLSINRQEIYAALECYLFTAPDELRRLLSDAAGLESFFYESSYSVGIAECINTIGRHEMIGISNTLFLKAKAWELLSLMIRQFCDGADGAADSHQMSLRRRDIAALQKARTLLIRNLKNPPTIHELSREVGLNRNKLQAGFKHLYGSTINSYLRDARLNRAKMLLMEAERQIAEVAEEVGYTNSSQFSKRFKEKFGMLPSEYVRAIFDGEEKVVC